MKKIIFLILFSSLFTGAIFSGERPKIYLDGNLNGKFIFELESSDDSEKQNQSAIGTDVSCTIMFSKLWGAHVSTGFAFPQENSASPILQTSGSANILQTTQTDKWYAFNTLIGPAISPFNNERFMISIIPGFVLSYEEKQYETKISSTASRIYIDEINSYSDTSVNIGAGAKTAANFMFKNGMYVTAGLEAALYFYNWTTQDYDHNVFIFQPYFDHKYSGGKTTKSSSCADLAIKPFIGFGFRF